MPENWLPITDYSAKHKISVSTLRRRIKADDIKYRFIEGKYLLLDEPVTTHSPHRPSLSDTQVSDPTASQPMQRGSSNKPEMSRQNTSASSQENFDGPILSAANRLLGELKKAYMQILQEKEEQILQLKEEVTDLKTLVRVLESENEKLSVRANPTQDLRGLDI